MAMTGVAGVLGVTMGSGLDTGGDILCPRGTGIGIENGNGVRMGIG